MFLDKITTKGTVFLVLLISSSIAAAEGENASNPLAKVKNTDVRWQYSDLDGSYLNNFFIDGAFMANEKLKLKYELHYWKTDISGQSESGFESVGAKAIYFPREGVKGNMKYRLAVGIEWIVDLGDTDKGIGFGADQIAPFFGVALGLNESTMVIPLVQHFFSYNGADISTTGFRVIALKSLPKQRWVKLDAIVPIEWENDNSVPASAELQIGTNINEKTAFYFDALVGFGGDKVVDWGLGIGLRFKY